MQSSHNRSGGFIVNELTFTNNNQGMEVKGIEDLSSGLSAEDKVVMESTGRVWCRIQGHLANLLREVRLA